ncbi:MAG: hypothetical protein IKR86_01985 [Candidatus Methanomethylophilaceae archaeon]|nr:hypothetical protein [Candidatus Methanomethylophilaceae archaeon]
MAGWCDWALAEYDREHPRLVGTTPPGTLLDEHARPIRPEYWRLSHGGAFVNLDELQMAHYRWSGTVSYDRVEGRHVVRTGYPRLDRILEGIVRDQGPDTPSILSAGMRERRAHRPPEDDRRFPRRDGGQDGTMTKRAPAPSWERRRAGGKLPSKDTTLLFVSTCFVRRRSRRAYSLA